MGVKEAKQTRKLNSVSERLRRITKDICRLAVFQGWCYFFKFLFISYGTLIALVDKKCDTSPKSSPILYLSVSAQLLCCLICILMLTLLKGIGNYEYCFSSKQTHLRTRLPRSSIGFQVKCRMTTMFVYCLIQQQWPGRKYTSVNK